jgi:transposase
MSCSRKWTKEEVEYLIEHAGVYTLEHIGQKLNRSTKALLSKLNRLGYTNIRELNGYMSCRQLALALGVSRDVVVRWIENHGLPASKKNYIRKNSKLKHYFINPEEFWKWAEENQDKINFARVKRYEILPEPAWVEQKRRTAYFSLQQKKRNKSWTKEEDQLLLKLLKENRTYKEIAEILDRSEKAVQMRKQRLLNKFGDKVLI